MVTPVQTHPCRLVLALLLFGLTNGFLLPRPHPALAQQTPATVQFSTSLYFAYEDTGSGTVTVRRSGNTTTAVAVSYATGKGLATPGVDYVAQSGTLNFAAGETSKSFSIPLIDDALTEGSENIELALSNPTGGAVLGAQATARFFVQDNENRGTLLDRSFNGAIDPTDSVNAIALQPDGKVVVAGTFVRANSSNPDHVVRFNSDGTRDAAFAMPNGAITNNVYALVLQPDGKIIIGGDFSRIGTTARGRIARLNADGTLDQNFYPGSGFNGNFAPGVYTIALQKDGKVVAGGNFETFNGVSRSDIIRLNSDGSLDTTFDPGSGVASTNTSFRVPWISAAAVQTDGKIVIGGQFTDVGGLSSLNIARLNADGSVDAGFFPGTGASGSLASVESVALQSDGKVIIGGDFTKVDGVDRNALARLNPDGSVDPTFDTGSGVMDAASDGSDIPGLVNLLSVQSDGKILFGGSFLTLDGINRHGIGRVNSDGSLDGSFGPYFGTTYKNDFGYEEYESVSAFAIQPDGRILTGATFISGDGNRTNRLTRLLSTNLRTSSFEFDSPTASVGEQAGSVTITVIRRGESDKAYTVEYTTSGGTASAGADYTARSGTVQFNALENKKTFTVPIIADKLLEDDETFNVILRNPSTGASLETPANMVVQIIDSQKAGNLDFSFAEVDIPFAPDPTTYRPVNAIVVQSDGKILVAGYFGYVNQTTRLGIFRLNSDGTIDPGFVPEPPPGFQIVEFLQMGVQPNGGIVGGFDGAHRLNADGSLDTAFAPDVSTVNALTVQKDGKIILSDEYFDSNAGIYVDEVLKFEADGTLNSTFSAPTLDDWVNAISIQPDGKIVLGGYFTQLGGASQKGIARLNADGSADASFNIGSGLEGASFPVIFALALQPDGKIIIGGDFSGVNGIGRNNLARLNADGSVDRSFDPGVGPNAFVESLAIQSDGKILIGGGFSSVNDIGRVGLARLNSDGSVDSGFTPKLTFTGAISLSSIALQADGQILIGGLFTAVNGAPRGGLARLNGGSGVISTAFRLDPAARGPSGLFRISITAQPGRQYQVQASTNLIDWFGVSTNTATAATVEVEDPGSANQTRRFYRALQTGP